MNNWMTAFLPVVGIIIGAALQSWFGRGAERGKHIDVLRAEAYADYLRAVASAAHLTSDDDLVAALRSAADAKTRIVIYGSVEAISALARFEEAGAVLSTERSVAAFIALVSAMRSTRAAVPEQDIRLVLLGPTRPHLQR